jgi:hypothetical protein
MHNCREVNPDPWVTLTDPHTLQHIAAQMNKVSDPFSCHGLQQLRGTLHVDTTGVTPQSPVQQQYKTPS